MNYQSKAKSEYHPPELRQISKAQIESKDRLVFASVKWLYSGDCHNSEIDRFVSNLFAEQATIEKFRVSSDVIPGSLGRSSVLVLAGNDCAVMAGILKENEPLIRRVPKFVFSENPDVEFKRILLECGADMVFDTVKIKHEECRAQMVAIWERYLIAKGGADQQFLVDQAISRIFRIALSKRELAVVQVLLANMGETVSRKDIVELSNLESEIKSENALSVLINRIRGKLFDGYEITSTRGAGYKLVESAD